MAIGISPVNGFLAEKVAGELLQNLLQISTSYLFCRGRAEDLMDTVNALVPVIEEIRGSGVDIPEPRRSHMDQISRCLQEGLEITRKILESPRYSVYRYFQLARKMEKLEKDISRFTRFIIQAHILAEVSHVRSEGAESFHRLEGSNHRIECSLLEIKVGRGVEMAGSSTEIPDAEEAWGSASRREREKVADGYLAEEAWATVGHSREREKGGDGYAAEEAWGSASRREREKVADGYPAEEAWATGGHSREREKGGDGYAAEEAWGSAGRREGENFAKGYPAEEAWATDGHDREGEKGGDGYDMEEAWNVGGRGRKGVKDVEAWAGAEEDTTVVGISGLKCGLKDSSV